MILKRKTLFSFCKKLFSSKLNTLDLVKFYVIDTDFNKHEVQTNVGWTLKSSILTNNIDLQTECDGSLTCAKCHCVLSPEITESPDYLPPSDPEEDNSFRLSPFSD